jgi:hypothetical protein
MVSELQYVAIAGYLLWCLISSLSSVLKPSADEESLVQHPARRG